VTLRKLKRQIGKIEDTHIQKILAFVFFRTVDTRKKVGAAKCEFVFDVHTSKVNQRLKVLHLWRFNVKTTRGFINIPLEDFHIDKTAP
jgi:hypothetical protein